MFGNSSIIMIGLFLFNGDGMKSKLKERYELSTCTEDWAGGKAPK